jgi:hypothetical protein
MSGMRLNESRARLTGEEWRREESRKHTKMIRINACDVDQKQKKHRNKIKR